MDKQNIFQGLRKIISEDNIKIDEPMSKHTSFKIGGPADFFVVAKTIEEVEKVLEFSKEKSVPLFITGNGSNLLVSDEGVRGVVLKIAIDNLEILELDSEETAKVTFQKDETKETTKIDLQESEAKGTTKNIIAKVGAGVKIMALAQEFKKQGISGFEELAGIPGTIGGANYMNAGAYGKEMKDIIVETKALNKETGKIETLKNEQQNLEYRNSIFKQKKYIILETTLRLQNGNSEEIEQKMNEYLKQRKEKQPLEYPSAGSTFKRGDGFITAKLIDECALKGYQIGGAQISEKHAGFIINKGNATSKDILDLIEYTKKKVFEKFGVQIEEEIEII